MRRHELLIKQNCYLHKQVLSNTSLCKTFLSENIQHCFRLRGVENKNMYSSLKFLLRNIPPKVSLPFSFSKVPVKRFLPPFKLPFFSLLFYNFPQRSKLCNFSMFSPERLNTLSTWEMFYIQLRHYM